MKNYFITTKTEKIEIEEVNDCKLYTIEKNIYRTWIKVNLNILKIGQIIIAYKLGRKWSEKEIWDFISSAKKGDYYILYLTRNVYNLNIIEYPIFEDKKGFGRDCYKGSINFALTSYTNILPVQLTYIEESEDKKQIEIKNI